ncbi:MAG TPA: peptidoglycan DD-metalloendopeptidase family protein [Aggregatilineales bacterium]|nr:peptidoglycan DD-metalloendopeptidase family protein [Aggregatilineales bacterium]
MAHFRLGHLRPHDAALSGVLLVAALLYGLAYGQTPQPTQPGPTPQSHIDSPCGVVDAIDYPIDGIGIENDDFGMYRAPFNGRHSGIDVAFDHYGDPIRAAARGRVTLSDPAGWGPEKGVVIIEHVFPDNNIYFTVYGHMEVIGGRDFPLVGQCVERGQVIGSEGHPIAEAPHLHYEIRRMKSSAGGPGYWYGDPLDAGWFHPVDFTEQWRLRLNPAFRKMVMAGGGPTAPPLWHADGSVTFAEEFHIEHQDASGQTLWRLDALGLLGVVELPDGRILGSTSDNQVIVVDNVNARFDASWTADRGLHSPPLRLGDSVVFLGNDNRVVSYDAAGHVRWQTDPLGAHFQRYAISGDKLAVVSNKDSGGGYRLSVIDPSGHIVYQADAPAPIIPFRAQGNGFILLVASQVGLLGQAMQWKPLMDTGQTLAWDSQVALDSHGNVLLYPGWGQAILNYGASGALRWQVTLPAPQTQPPLLGVGNGCLDYVLSSDGGLLAYRAADGALRGFTTLYTGGNHGHPASRFLSVLENEHVQFSAGYLSIATIDGPTLANDCKAG